MNTACGLIIGGPARCGKSTAAAVLRKRLGCVHLPGDALVDAVTPWLKDKIQPTIRNQWPVEQWLAAIRTRDVHVSRLLLGAVNSSVAAGAVTILDGTVWPSQLTLLQHPSAAVFMVDTGDQTDRLLSIAHDENAANNWHRGKGWSDEEIAHWGTYNRQRSLAYVAEAVEHGAHVVDVAEAGIAAAVEQAVEKLLRDLEKLLL